MSLAASPLMMTPITCLDWILRMTEFKPNMISCLDNLLAVSLALLLFLISLLS